MPAENLAVNDAAISALRQMAQEILDIQTQLEQTVDQLQDDFAVNKSGLGPHSASIGALISRLEAQSKPSARAVRKLALKVEAAADNRQSLLDGTGNAADTAAILGRIYDSEYRQRRAPGETAPDGQAKGSWQGDTFVIHDDYIPAKFNPDGKTFGELCRKMEDDYGLHYSGTPFVDGYADFSGVAVAQVDLGEIVNANIADDPSLVDAVQGIDFETIYSRRDKNFDYADAIAAAKQIPIPGLSPGYSKDDLKQWRKDNGFTWDESFRNGYVLVPGFIHGNTGHTGLVGVGTHGSAAEAHFAAAHGAPDPN